MIGVASFLQKFSMKELNPYQVNFLMAIGMLLTAVPALSIKQGNLAVLVKSLPLGAPIGLLMALGLSHTCSRYLNFLLEPQRPYQPVTFSLSSYCLGSSYLRA